MPSIWKKDKIPINNTLEKELARMERILTALEIALLEKRTKHVMRDLEELRKSHDEMLRLVEEHERRGSDGQRDLEKD